MHLKPAEQAMREQFGDVDASLNLVIGESVSAQMVMAQVAVTQVKATCALVHAVREMNETLRTLRR